MYKRFEAGLNDEDKIYSNRLEIIKKDKAQKTNALKFSDAR